MVHPQNYDCTHPCGHMTEFWALGNQLVFMASCSILRIHYHNLQLC